MKTKITIPIMVSSAVLLAACGGGGNKTTSNTKSVYNITGTVPGTLIEAFCEDGSYHAVKSKSNSSNKHPFVLNLPTDLSCRLVMTTNEDDINNKVITPIKLIKASIKSIAFSGRGDIDLGHIPLAMNRGSMSSDTNGDGVEDSPYEIDLSRSSGINEIDIIEKNHDPMDDDGDDIINVYEDDDHDGVNNRDDNDDDGDGVLDTDDRDRDNDHDGDGIDDHDDNDDDNDGIDDDDEKHDDDDDSTGPIDPTDPVITTPSAGRLLAAQCAQCHRTDANPNKGFEDLIGEDIYGELMEMKGKNKVELMHLQAKGYSEAQIRLIDDYFRSLSSSSNNGGK